ncbi:UNVERIFIED_CONTAM: hypothetical protein K2H54_048311 [Gekko kuhli]
MPHIPQTGELGLFLSGEARLFCSGERRRWRCRILPPAEAAAEAQALLSGRGGETGEAQGEGVEAAAAKEEEGGGGGGGGGGSGWWAARGGLPRDPPAPVGLPRAVDDAEEEEEEEAPPATPAGVCVATAGPLPFPSAAGRVGLAVREEGGGGGGGG